jgi:hypothetical protein
MMALADIFSGPALRGRQAAALHMDRDAFWASQFPRRLRRRGDRACQEQSQDTIAVAATGYFEQDVLARP